MVISFNKEGYEPFLDFIKAYAIVCVLMGHTLPYLHETGYSLWYGMQVPLFVLIQAFHVLKKNTYTLNFSKILQRVFLPYLIIQMLPFCYLLYKGLALNEVANYYTSGGIGPGSYYPWIYLQLAVILPFAKSFFNVKPTALKLFAAIVVCEGLEILFSLASVPDSFYRLLAVRYLFLIYLGWIWVKEGIVLNAKTLMVSLLSMAAIIYFDYFYTPTEPWFYDTAWRTHRWPCYYYVSTLLCGVLYYVYLHVRLKKIVSRSIKMLAKCSYEIFLIQMVVIPFLPPINFIEDALWQGIFRIALIFMLSIIGGYFYNKYYNIFLTKIKQR